MSTPQQLVLDVRPNVAPTLDNFCAGPNAPALAHLRGVLMALPVNPAQGAVPVYLWGEGGCGKTHLLKGLQTAWTQAGRAVGWLGPDTDPGGADWDAAWAAVLIDDVHALDAAQQHLAFQWFVQAQGQAVPVVACADCPPADLHLREDLRTRLAWGTVFALRPLSEAQRGTVLRQAAQARGLRLSDEVLAYLMHRFSRDLGSLMTLLAMLDDYALQTRRAVTIALVKSMMNDA